jgi:hypothetical protein
MHSREKEMKEFSAGLLHLAEERSGADNGKSAGRGSRPGAVAPRDATGSGKASQVARAARKVGRSDERRMNPAERRDRGGFPAPYSPVPSYPTRFRSFSTCAHFLA